MFNNSEGSGYFSISERGEDEVAAKPNYIMIKTKKAEEQNQPLQQLTQLLIKASDSEPYSLTFPDVFRNSCLKTTDIGFDVICSRGIQTLTLERIDVETPKK